MGLLVGSPILAFPFSRTYTIFFLLIIIVGVLSRRSRVEWRRQKGLMIAICAVGLPLLLTISVLTLQYGEVEILWIEKLALIGVGGLLSFALAGILIEPRIRHISAIIISFTVAFFIVDGVVQLFIGYDFFGIPLDDLGNGEARVQSFFSKPRKFGYFIGFFTVAPAFWMYFEFRRKWPVHLLVGLGAVVVFAAGSRYTMAGYVFFIMIYVIVVAFSLQLKLRLVVLLGAPVFMLLLSSLMFYFNDSFQSRMLQTSAVLQKFDREALNHALSLRLDIWEPAIEMISERPVFGYGPSEFERQVEDRLDESNVFASEELRVMHAHQVSIEIMLGTGFVGLTAFLAWYVWLTRYLWLRRRHVAFGWGCLLAYLLLWLPFGTQKDFYGSEQVLFSFYLLGLGFGFTEYSDETEVIDKHLDE